MITSILEYNDYKKGINDWIAQQPSHGHGQFRRIAEHLNVNSVVMSQVFRGNRELTLEQAVALARFVGFTELERDYFLLLVQRSRAGSHELKTVLDKQLAAMQASAQALKNRIKHEKFNDEDRATFYSHWYYSAVRLGTSIPELSNITAIADYLGLERSLVAKVVEFLLKNNLIKSEKRGLNIGPQITHVGHDSPFVLRHHVNWRIQSLKSMENKTDEDLYYTGPMALSKVAARNIRKLLLSAVENATKEASISDSEALRCLNIDWFAVGNPRGK